MGMTAISVKKLDKAIDLALLTWLSPQGFVAADGGGVERWDENRYDYVGCIVNRVGGENAISLRSDGVWSYPKSVCILHV
jgi:hypothetical protein